MSHAAKNQRNVYTNPAFCQQSEFYGSPQQQQQDERCKSPQRARAVSVHQRQPPLGALSPSKDSGFHETSHRREAPPPPGPKPKLYQQQPYEEMLVDDSFCMVQKPHQYQANRYESIDAIEDDHQVQIKQTTQQIRYVQQTAHEFNGGVTYEGDEEIVDEEEQVAVASIIHQKTGSRYEYIPMQEHERCKSPPARRQQSYEQEEVEVAPGVMHRYAVIPQVEETQFVSAAATTKGRYALVPVEEVPAASKNRYAVVSQQELQPSPQPQIQQQPQPQNGRYEYIPEPSTRIVPRQQQQMQQQQRQMFVQPSSRTPATPTRNTPSTVTSPTTPIKGNPIATAKLHELLSTPRKTPQRSSSVQRTPQKTIIMMSPDSPRRAISPIYQPQHQGPYCSTPNQTPTHQQLAHRRTSPHHRSSTPKAQQKLNYSLSTRQQELYDTSKRHTAVIAPICSSPVQSVYSETTFSNKTESWMNLSLTKAPVQASLAVAALMMVLCGAVSSGLCFYMISIMGRLYYLDFGLVAGFACFVLGCLGFRSRNCYWLPNRNYISGYVILSIFSLLTCVALLLLLFMQPKPGSPWADVTSGAVCGISGLSLLLAASGVIASYCCKYPPPDNRVEHCARGFTV